jgi:hypothetical protein
MAEGLGRLFDIGLGVAPQAINNSADVTGKRIALSGARGITFVVVCEAGTAGDDLDLDLQEHTAYTGGTSRDLDVIDHYYMKSETALDNDEAWVKYTQSAASEITDAGGAGTSAEQQQIVVIELDASAVSDDATHVSLDFRNAGTNNDKIGCVLYIVHTLRYQRKPTGLRNLLRPSAANA